MGGKSKYSAAQKHAYYSGMGYAAADAGKKIQFKSDANKASFRAGYKAGSKKVANYPARKGGTK